MLTLLVAVLLLWLVLLKGQNPIPGLPLRWAGLLAAALALLNNLVGHFFAPLGLLLTPTVVVNTTACIVTARGSSSPVKVLVLTAIIIGHDIGLKLYAGGMHDNAGQGWMSAYLLMGLLPAYGGILFYVATRTAEPLFWRVLSVLLLPLLLAGYCYFFGNLGLGRSY